MATRGNIASEIQAEAFAICIDWAGFGDAEEFWRATHVLGPVARRTRSTRAKLKKSETTQVATKGAMEEVLMVSKKRQRASAVGGARSKDTTDGFRHGASGNAVRTMEDYKGAVYPCTVYEDRTEYVVVSPACPSSMGSSDESVAAAIDDLRLRIETDIREIIEDGRDWWAEVGDRKLVPLPDELPSTSDEALDEYLRKSGFEIRRKSERTIRVFAEDA